MESRSLNSAWARFLCLLLFPALVYGVSDIRELSAELVTPTSGWAIYHHRLLWTGDVGASWKDITPPLSSDESIASTFFLSPSAGFVAILREGADPKGSLIFAMTSDGGQTWQKSVVEAASRFLTLPQIWAGSSHIFFLDAMNGWLELQRVSSSNFKDGILLATKDGGKSWTELPRPPTVDKMTWISPELGWIAGGVLQGDLFVTRDGGLTWQKQTPPVPSGTTDTFGQAAPPKFTDAQHGTFVMTFHGLKVNDSGALIAVYRTSDSGRTWIRSDLQEVSSLGGSAGVSLGGTPVWARFAKGAVETTMLSNTNSTQIPSTAVAPSFYVVSSSFADANTGLLLVHNDTCDAAKNCMGTWRLLSTRDAGRSVVDVTPPKPSNSASHAGVAESTQQHCPNWRPQSQTIQSSEYVLGLKPSRLTPARLNNS